MTLPDAEAGRFLTGLALTERTSLPSGRTMLFPWEPHSNFEKNSNPTFAGCKRKWDVRLRE